MVDAFSGFVQMGKIVSRDVWGSCVMHVLVAALTPRFTLINSGCTRAGGLQDPTFLHLFTLQHLYGVPRIMDEVSRTIASAALPCAGSVFIQRYHTPSHILQFWTQSFMLKAKCRWQIFSDTNTCSFEFIACLCKLTKTQMQHFKIPLGLSIHQ